MFKDPLTYRAYHLDLDIIQEVLEGPFTATLQMRSIFPFEEDPDPIVKMEVLSKEEAGIEEGEGELKGVMLKLNTTKFEDFCPLIICVGGRSHHLKLTTFTKDWINITLHKDHPLYERLHEPLPEL